MDLLRFLCVVVFIISFLHACLLVGFLYQVPGAGKLYGSYVEKQLQPWVSIPVKVYAWVGTRLWSLGYGKELLKSVYKPLIKTGGRDVSADRALRMINIRFWNRVVLGSLAVFLWLTLLARRRRS